MTSNEAQISQFLQRELVRRALEEVAAIEAARWLDSAGLLADSSQRPGKHLRELLRSGKVIGSDQRPPTSNGRWFIVRADLEVSGDARAAKSQEATRSVAAERPRDAFLEIEAARTRFRPEDIRVLIVGESPPAGGTFFYLANSILFEATREAFARSLPEVGESEDFLASFCRAGCFLEDLCQEPVNRLSDADREAARQRGVAALADRLHGLKPDLVIIAMKAIAPHVERALTGAGIPVDRARVVPFPRPEWRVRYIEELAGHLSEWKAGTSPRA